MKLLTAILLLSLTSVISGLDFKLAVVVEQNAVDISLIDLAVSRRVNSNWKLLPGHTMSHITVQVSADGAQEAVRKVCSQPGLSALLAVGSCALVSELSSLAKSLQLPFIALPTALCTESETYIQYGAVGRHTASTILDAAVKTMSTMKEKRVAIIYDSSNAGFTIPILQTRLSSIGISSITFDADPFLPGDLSEKLRRLMKKRVFNAIVMATPHNAVAIVAAAANASVMQQNYFWLVIDSGGLSKSHLLPLCPSNCNLALLRGGTTGINEPSGCPPAVRDVFPSCDTDSIRTLDIRLVDAIEALAKALTDSLTQSGFQTSNASCFPLQPWSSGAYVLSNVLSMSNFDSDRGVISYNSTTGFFNAQGVEVVASLTERVGASARFVLSGWFSGGSLTKLFHKSGAWFVFPNTFTGFNNATIVICSPSVSFCFSLS